MAWFALAAAFAKVTRRRGFFRSLAGFLPEGSSHRRRLDRHQDVHGFSGHDMVMMVIIMMMMDGWMDGWMAGWLDGWMDGWLD